MLREPNFADALDTVKGALFKDDKEKYLADAKAHAQAFASASDTAIFTKYKIDNK